MAEARNKIGYKNDFVAVFVKPSSRFLQFGRGEEQVFPEPVEERCSEPATYPISNRNSYRCSGGRNQYGDRPAEVAAVAEEPCVGHGRFARERKGNVLQQQANEQNPVTVLFEPLRDHIYDDSPLQTTNPVSAYGSFSKARSDK